MCDVINGTLELLFAHLSLNNVQHIKPLLMDAIDEYQAIRRSMSYEEKHNLNFVKNLLWHAERGEWADARDKLNDAQRAYQEYIGKKTEIMKKPLGNSHIHGKRSEDHSHSADASPHNYMFRNEDIPEPSARDPISVPIMGIINSRNLGLLPSCASIVRVPQPLPMSRASIFSSEDQGPTFRRRSDVPRYAGHHEYPTEARADTLQQEHTYAESRGNKDENLALDDAAKEVLGSQRPTKIGEAHWSLYKHEWRRAFEAIKRTGIQEEKAVGCLFYIVQEAYQFCLLEAKAQVLEFESAALNILTEGMYSQEQRRRLEASGNLKHMIRYRHEVADVAVDRLQEVFLTRILPLIHRKYCVRTGSAIDSFARQCVEVTWRMAIQDPPLHLVFENESSVNADFDHALYEPYTCAGTKVKFYVWPALRLYVAGPILCRGVAQGESHSER